MHELIMGDIVSATAKAILLDVDGHEVWVPRSVIDCGEDLSEFSDQTEFWIERWFCENEGLV